MTTKVPDSMNPYECTRFLETRDRCHLSRSFYWSDTPQGVSYWGDIAAGIIPLTESDIILLEGWILESTFTTP
jgi:hypothetical protein